MSEPSESSGRAWPGVLSVGLALTASLALSLQQLGRIGLPGCGLESACARVSRSVWGSLPGLDWSTAHVGTAFFLGLLLAWLVGGGRVTNAVRALASLGALVSLLLFGVMFAQKGLCPWCMAAHAGNLAFVACVWRAPRGKGGAPLVLLGFVLGTFALAGPEFRRRRAERRLGEAELAESLERLQDDSGSAFTGRWRRGPERAPVRIVLFTDYECPDCRAMEAQVDEVLERWPEASFSVKHYPFCADCNARVRATSRNPHPNACRAARAAEAAGLVGGEEAFWRMHRWLFEREGEFSASELRTGVDQLGLDADAFFRELEGARTLAHVTDDIAEGQELGLYVTPMIFVNGEELRGWNAERALVRAVETLMESAPRAAAATEDRPVAGLARLVDEWRRARPRRLPVTPPDRWLAGEARPDSIEVIVWGDYLDPPTRELDARIRAFAATEPRVRYAFRLFPLEASCNPGASTRYAGACAAALAAAASFFDGRAAHLRLHERLMAGASPGPATHPGAGEALSADLEAARRVRLHAVPLCFVDRRPVQRWRLEGQPVIEEILRAALGE